MLYVSNTPPRLSMDTAPPQISLKLTCFIPKPGTGDSIFSRIGWIEPVNSFVPLTSICFSTLSHPTANKCTNASPFPLFSSDSVQYW